MAALAALALLGGCATVRPRTVPANAMCDAAKAQSFVGNAASEAGAGQARAAAGAKVVRLLTPGDVVTMEYRADRLTVVVDESGHVATVRCG